MKSFKKALAASLALAMVVTAVPVASAEAATTAKLNTKSVTVAAGTAKKQAKNIKVTTPSTWKSVKVVASSSNKNAATVKVSGKTVKVTAVKKGTAKVTVKVTGKKSGKTVKKTLTATAKVVNAGISFKAPTDVVVGSETKLAAKACPSAAKLTYASSDETVATVDAEGTVKALKAGKTTITIKSDYGTTKTVDINVKAYVLKDVKQTKANVFEAVVLGKTSDIKAADIKVTNKATNATYAVKAVSVDAKDATKVTIETFSEFTDGATYVVTLDGTAVEVSVSDGVVTDVSVSPVQIPANTEGTEIKAQTIDKNGVVLKEFTTVDNKPNNVDFSLTTTQGYVNGAKLVLPVVGNKGTAEVTYHTYKYDENAKEVGALTKKVEIVAVAEEAATVSGYNYTIAKNAPDWTKAVTTVSKFALGDPVKAYFHFVDSKKNDITAQYSVVSSNDSVLLLPETSLAATSSVAMVAVKAGSAYINVLKDGKVVTSLPVTVTDTRKLVNITLGASSLSISNAATGYTTGDVTVKGLDQYGEEIDIDSVTPTVLTNTDAAKKIVTNYSSGKVTVNVAGVDKGTYVIKLEAAKGSDKVAKTITVNSVATTKTAADATDLRLEISDSKIDLAIADDADAEKAAKSVTAKVVAYDQGVKVGEISGAKFTLNDKTDNINPSTGVVNAVTVDNNKATKHIGAGTYVVKASYDVVVKDANGNPEKNADGTDKTATKTFSGSFTVVDTQATATVKINTKKTTKTVGKEILAETCVASYKGKDYRTFDVESKEVIPNGNYTYIGNATVTVTNGKVSYDVPVAINTTFTK